ncbi:MAG TPA: DUF3142 domain-containing protein [Pyrinomonadaceae bacterium]|nr:DUF3142 domain-containing protein [Pyrinomonadaceae bacterium]
MRLVLIIILLPILLALFAPARTTQPEVFLWAWERPEDLTFINPQKTGVAFLAKTIYLRGDKVVVRPRLQPLKVTPGTKLVAVVRIETDRVNTPTLSSLQAQQTATEIRNSSVSSVVQIDFDAKVSERNFYRSLLQEVRQQLPASTKLSITALASWCAGDDWLHDLPIDEAVPMLFRLGVDQRQFQRRLETGQPFESRQCQNAAGVSTDEPVTAPTVDRLYIFNPQSWSKNSFATAMETYQR